jgi:hypothetical protein
VAKKQPDLDHTQAKEATPYALHARSASWSGLSGVPGGLDDGDDDTTYTAGAGLRLSGTAGQPDAGAMGGRYALYGGFWGGGEVENQYTLYLPLVPRDAPSQF